MSQTNSCFLCGFSSTVTGLDHFDTLYRVSCKTCGDYVITDDACQTIQDNRYAHSRWKISTYIRRYNIEASDRKILSIYADSKNAQSNQHRVAIGYEDAMNAIPTDVTSRLDIALLNLAKLSPSLGHRVPVSMSDHPLLCAENKLALLRIIDALAKMGLLVDSGGASQDRGLEISVEGWKKVAELMRGNRFTSKQGFVAMWFDPSMDDTYKDGFKAGIEAAGFSALRISDKQHNDQITDQIIAEIRRSRFVVADFTGNRGGVYYEAGFAKGLGIEVIWTCREDHLKDVHFDTKGFSHLVWKTPEDLKDKLSNRIRATVV